MSVQNAARFGVEEALQRASNVIPHARLVRLSLLGAGFERAQSDPSTKTAVGVQQTISRDPNTDTFRVRSQFQFQLQPPDFEERADVTCTYLVDYEVKTETLDEEDVTVFCLIFGLFTAWPSVREFLQSAMARLDMPQATLPMLTVPGATEAAGFGKKQEPEHDK